MPKTITKLISVALLVMPSITFAGLIDFTGLNEGVEDEFVFSQGDVNLTITAWTANVKTNQELVSDRQRLSGGYGV